MRAIIIYWSAGGNTAKVAQAIQEGLQEGGAQVTTLRVEQAGEVDWFDYDLVCIGFPSYQWRPPKPMDEYLNGKFDAYRRAGYVRVGAPVVPGRNALLFCTYSGQHTGLREATPAVLYAGQFFEHLGFATRGEWYIVGEYHGNEEASTCGRLGDIRGRPNADDLRQVRQDAARLAQQMI